MSRRLAVLAACTCLVAGLSACGGSNDEGKVKTTVNALYAGFAERDAQKVCGALTTAQQRAIAKGATGNMKGQSCRQVMGFALGFVGAALKDAKQAKVTKVTLSGEKARATVVYKGKAGVLGLTKEAGNWKVSELNLNKL